MNRYIIVPSKPRAGAATQSMLIVDENEKTVKAFPFKTGDGDAQFAAWLAADKYVEEVLRKDPQ